jgi:hypothetical protein
MDVSQEIARHLEKLPPESQERVLRFVASLAASAPAGENGANLRQFASSIDSVSADSCSTPTTTQLEGSVLSHVIS